MLQFFSKSEKMQETNKHMLMLGRTKLVTNDFFPNFSIKALILFAEIFVYKTSDGGGRWKRGKKCVCAAREVYFGRTTIREYRTRGSLS